MVRLTGYYFLGFTSETNGQSFVPPQFDPVDPIDMMRMTTGNMTFIPYKMGVLAMPMMCTTPTEIIESAASMMGSNSTDGNNNTTQAIKELASGQVGIGQNMTGQELQQALNLVVCIPSMMNNTMLMSNTQDNLTGNVKDGMLMR